jgi:signal peptidase
MDALAPATERAAKARPKLERTLRLADRASSVVCGLAVATLIALLGAMALGYRPLIDHSDSMKPAIRAGDVVITHYQLAASIRPGEIVSFNDPVLDNRLVTHRVVSVDAAGAELHFVTRGDANAAPESWTAARGSRLGVVVLRIPAVGRAIAWMGDRWVRAVLLALVAFLLGVALLRRIWRP